MTDPEPRFSLGEFCAVVFFLTILGLWCLFFRAL